MSNPQDYIVGWICAIPLEYVAAQAFLDEIHERPELMSPHDHNSYTLGRIGKHNVVIAVLPAGEYGTNSAAGVAIHMLRSFPSIRIGLLVGIGGGAPSLKHDIRLGDVVVSAPRNGKSGVFQYDMGKTIQEQSFLATGFLNQPPLILRSAVAEMRAQYEAEGHRIEDQINEILRGRRRLQRNFGRPGPDEDRLYLSTVIHPTDNQDTCAKVCGNNPRHLISRAERDDDEDNPKIHYGQIASANQLMKDALLRDKLAKEHQVLCFEMEAAGLMNQFPCLVIRGICDHSDTHKNKTWQGYAAMTAAAYAKDLLNRIPSPKMFEAEPKINDVLASDLPEVRLDIGDEAIRQKRDQIKNWLSAPDPSTNYKKALQQRQQGTGTWLLHSKEFTQWNTRHNSLLWLYGISGCGKTILSSTVIQYLEKRSSQPLLYFYFDFNDTRKQYLKDMVMSLISQLYTRFERTQKPLDALFGSCDSGRSQPSCQSLCSALTQMIEQVDEVWVVLDALDECRTRAGSETQGLLRWIATFLNSKHNNAHLLVTSGPEQDIVSELNEIAREEKAIISIQSDLVKSDIEAYIEAKIIHGDGLKRWQHRPDVQDKIKSRLVGKANGIFRWVSCQIDALGRCLEQRSLEKALASLPETLDETYDRILNSIPGENKESAVRILQLLTYSERPLSVAEAVDAIAVDINEKPNFDPKHRMPDPDEILIYCSSLVVIVPMLVNVDDRLIDDEDSDKNSEKDENSDKIQPDAQKAPGKHMKTIFVLQLAHFSVKEYLTSNRFYGPLSSELHETTARVSIAVVCLSYLLQFDRYLSHRKIVAEFPFTNYCAVSWLHHAAAVEEESSEIMDLIGRLFCYNPAAYRVCYRLYCPDTASESSRRDKGTTRPAPALYYAAMGNLYSMVKLLIDNGADVNAKGGLQSYALHIASKQGHERIVQLLIERGANVSAFGGRHQYNALMEASSEGHTLIVKRLLEHGMDVNAQNANNSHALEVAAASAQEHSQTLQLLLDSGAYDTRTVDCRSAVEKASMCGHSEAVELLLERGADIYKKHTIFVEEALEVACRARNERIIKLLLNKGTGMYATSHVWELFHEEVIRDRQVTAKALLEGAYIALKGNVPRNYCTVVNFCARLGRTYLLRLIYENFETDTYVSEPYGRTPLHLAAEGGHIESFEYLIGLGADPTVLDAKGDGILCYAAVGGNSEMVNTILNKTLGSEWYSIHWSPLHWACRAGQAEIVKLLLEKSLYSHLITTDDLEGQLSPLDVVTYAGQGQMLKHLPITSRLLLGFYPGSERYSSERFEIPNVCKGCQLPSYGLDYQCLTCSGLFPDSEYSEYGEPEGFKQFENPEESDGSDEFEENAYSRPFVYCFMCKPFLSYLHEGHEWREHGCGTIISSSILVL